MAIGALTALFSRKQPGGVYTIQDMKNTPGDVFFVGSAVTGAVDSVGAGRSPDKPMATLDYAISNGPAANTGGVIYLLPNHAESSAAAASLFAADVAGIRVVGLGEGEDRPTFTFGHADTVATISAANITFENVLFVAGIDSVAAPITITGTDWAFIDCEWRDTTDIEFIRAFITTAAADRGLVRRCFYNGYLGGDANANFCRLVGNDSIVFEDCRFMTKVTTAVIEFHTTLCTNVIVRGCDFQVSGTTDLTKNVVDTVTGSVWEVVGSCFDLGAGSSFSGGSGGALAGDDIGAVATDVTTILAQQAGAAGVAAYPAAAAPANGVSMAEVIRAIYDQQVGNGTGTGVNSKLGIKVEFAAADVLDTVQNALFTVSGGKVLITALYAETSVAANSAGASNTQFISNPTVGTDAPLCAVLDIDADEAGTIYGITGAPGDAMTGGSGGGAPVAANPFVVAEGTIDVVSAADSGAGGALLAAALWYIPLDDTAAVA